jgi:hypothetical protein
MPNFNNFNINEDLLGRVLKSKKNDCILSNDEEKESRDIYHKYCNRSEKKSITHLLYEILTKKKLVKFTDSNNVKRYRVSGSNEEYIPVKQILSTFPRPMEFGDDLFGWIKYIQSERKRIEEERIQTKNINILQNEMSKVYSTFIQSRMMKLE